MKTCVLVIACASIYGHDQALLPRYITKDIKVLLSDAGLCMHGFPALFEEDCMVMWVFCVKDLD